MKYILNLTYEIEASSEEEAIKIFDNRGMKSHPDYLDKVKLTKEDICLK